VGNCALSYFKKGAKMNEYLSDCNNPKEFEQLTKEQQEILLDWISINFLKTKTYNKERTSYGLKHIFESSKPGFYVTNGQFKGAMEKIGFTPHNKTTKNSHYKISKKSLCLKQEY
jgi:hypothetical protein